MASEYLIQRLAGIQAQLIAAHAAGKSMSSSSKGREREAFINDFLKGVFPNSFRFGTGDATDATGNRSGQLDVVIEYPFGPSLPAVGSSEVRLYLAESVAAVIEVKSDLSLQWGEVEGTTKKLKALRREFGSTMSFGNPPGPQIPIIAVGYEGWKTRETLQEKLQNSPIDAALIINPGIFVAGGLWAVGSVALWAMISFMHHQIMGLQSASTEPFSYIRDA